MILLIDNYDSFVYNLARYLEELGQETLVLRNDCSLGQIAQINPQAIIISPGPCTPEEAGISVEVVRQCSDDIPILGVCLGHQAIGAAFGGTIVRAPFPVHGKVSAVTHNESYLFDNIPNPLMATRYHSLIIERDSLPADLTMTAWTADGLIMAVQHNTRPVYGVQFHPESILTQHGHRLLANFLDQAGMTPPEYHAHELLKAPRTQLFELPPETSQLPLPRLPSDFSE